MQLILGSQQLPRRQGTKGTCTLKSVLPTLARMQVLKTFTCLNSLSLQSKCLFAVGKKTPTYFSKYLNLRVQKQRRNHQLPYQVTVHFLSAPVLQGWGACCEVLLRGTTPTLYMRTSLSMSLLFTLLPLLVPVNL